MRASKLAGMTAYGSTWSVESGTPSSSRVAMRRDESESRQESENGRPSASVSFAVRLMTCRPSAQLVRRARRDVEEAVERPHAGALRFLGGEQDEGLRLAPRKVAILAVLER